MSHITQKDANELFGKIRKHKFHDTLDSDYARRVTMLCNAAIKHYIDRAALAQPEPVSPASDEFLFISLLEAAEQEPHATPRLVNACRSVRAAAKGGAL